VSAVDADVIIVGAGPVGLVTALGLAQAGVSVRVLEREPSIVDSPRAIVYHWTVLEGLAELGILDDVAARGFRKTDYAFRIHETGEMLRYSIDTIADETPYPYNVHLGQHELAAVALEHLERLPGTSVQWGAEVTAIEQDRDGVTVTTTLQTTPNAGTTPTHRASWVIGSDGARSTMRKLLGIPFEGFTWPQRFVATNVEYDFDCHDYARATFNVDHVHGAVIAKINNAGMWRVTYAEDGALDEATVADRAGDRLAAITPDDVPCRLDRIAPYRMHQRAASTFRDGRVLLAGDAAHATNPTGGLGLTGGLFDGFSLSSNLASVIRESADDALLDDWASERRRIFLEITSPAASENKRIIYSKPDAERRRQDIEDLRRALSDPVMLRERLKFTEKLRSTGV
jgi:3-(3-hydroxy-phenyl)propionate hydroxylase